MALRQAKYRENSTNAIWQYHTIVSIPPETQLLRLWQLLLVYREVGLLVELNEVRAKVISLADKRFDVLGQHVELQCHLIVSDVRDTERTDLLPFLQALDDVLGADVVVIAIGVCLAQRLEHVPFFFLWPKRV